VWNEKKAENLHFFVKGEGHVGFPPFKTGGKRKKNVLKKGRSRLTS